MHIREFFIDAQKVLDDRRREPYRDEFRLTHIRQVLRAEYVIAPANCLFELIFDGKAKVSDTGHDHIEKVYAPLEIVKGPRIRKSGGDFSLADSVAFCGLVETVQAKAAEVVSMASAHSLYTEHFRLTEPEYNDPLDRWAGYEKPWHIERGSTRSQLKDYCREYGLKVSGNKDELAKRLLKYADEHGDTFNYAAYQAWMASPGYASFEDALEEIP